METKGVSERVELEFIDSVLDAQIDTFFLFEPSTSKAVRWNRAFREISGYTDEEISRLPAPTSYYSPEDLKRAEKFIGKIMEGESGTIEMELICKDGSRIPTEYQGSIIRDDLGEPKYLISIGRDISGRKKLEETMKKSSVIMETTSDAVITTDVKGRITYWNSGAEGIYGYQKNEIIGKSVEILYKEKDLNTLHLMITELLVGNEIPEIEVTNVDKDQNDIEVLLSLTTIKNENGEVVELVGLTKDITKRKRAENALKSSETRHRAVSELISDYAYSYNVDPDGEITHDWVAGALKELTGYSSQEIHSMGGWEHLLHPDDMKIALSQLKALLENRKKTVEYRIITKDGRTRWMKDTARPIWSKEQKRVIRLEGAVQDITSHKESEEALKEERDKAQKYLDLAGVIFVAIDSSGNVTLLNQKGCEILGVHENEVLGKNWFDNFIPAVSRDEVKMVFNKLMAGEIEPVEKHENIVITSNGEERIIAWYNSILKDENGKIVGTLSSGDDITKRKQVEEKLKNSQSNLIRAQKIAQLGSWVWHTGSNQIFMSEEMYSIMGMDKDMESPDFDPNGKTVHPDDRELLYQKITSALKNKEPYTLDYRIFRTDNGEERNLHVETEVETIADSENLIIYGIVQDITEKIKAEKEIAKARIYFDRSLSSAPDGVFLIDKNGIFTFANPAFLKMLGFNEKEIVGGTLEEIIPKIAPPETVKILQDRVKRRLETGKQIVGAEVELLNKNGGRIPISYSASGIKDEMGNVIGDVVFLRDITDQKNAEKEIGEHKNLSRFYLDLLTHDIGNIHQALYGNVQLSKMTSDPIIIGSYIESLEKDLIRSMRITRNLKLLAGINEKPFGPKPIQFQRSIDAAIYRLRSTYPTRNIKITKDLDADSKLLVDEYIDEVFFNLLHNAVIVQNGGDPVIEIGSRTRDDCIEINISDQGPGIPDDHKEKVLSRMDSSNGEYQRGVGLALVKALMSRYGGSISINDRVQGDHTYGARFTLSFPFYDP